VPRTVYRMWNSRPISPSALVRRFRAHPQLMRHLHWRHVLLKQLCGLQPHPLTPGPPSGGQATTIGISHNPGIDPLPAAITQARRL